jgi:ABC-type sugar transport system permease subunit
MGHLQSKKVSFLFALPAWIIYTGLLAIPIILALFISFAKWNGFSTIQFIGFDNYRRVFTDRRLSNAVAHTLIISFFFVVSVNIAGLFLAMLVNRPGPQSNIFRSVFFCPFILSSVAVSFVWKSILSYNGVLNTVLAFLGLDNLIGNYFSSGGSALFCVCIVEIWRSLGYYMVIYLAALQTVPAELYEACTVDGGGPWHRFTSVTLPMIVPGATVSVLMSIINILRLSDTVKVLTDGGPGYDTETIVYNIVAQGFSNNLLGYSSAIAVVLFIVIGGITIGVMNVSTNLEAGR